MARSDRSACYLASGRPVVLQGTGFSSWPPCGVGLLAFESAAGAAAAAADVLARYAEQREAAREIAVSHFSYREVNPRLLAVALGETRPTWQAEATT